MIDDKKIFLKIEVNCSHNFPTSNFILPGQLLQFWGTSPPVPTCHLPLSGIIQMMYLYSSLPSFLLVLSLLIFPIKTFVTLFLPSFWDGFPNFLPHIPNFNFCRPQIWRYGLWFCSGCDGNIGLWSGPGPDQLHFCQLYGCLQLNQEPKALRTGLLRVPAWPVEAGREQQSALSPL